MLFSAVGFYQNYISALKMGPTCRFEPSCSRYSLEAFSRHGAARGMLLTLVRLAKCGPWHPGGFDPVPRRGVGRGLRTTWPTTSTTTKEF